jgi:hypothetical protein
MKNANYMLLFFIYYYKYDHIYEQLNLIVLTDDINNRFFRNHSSFVVLQGKR